MKIKTSTIVLSIFSVLIIIFGLVYFNGGQDALNFTNNQSVDLYTPPPGPTMEAGGIFDGTPRPFATIAPENGETGEPSLPSNSTDSSNTSSAKPPQVPNSNVNILLIGKDQSAGLTDTLMILSINQSKKEAKLISVPRDAYVPYGDSVVKAIKKAGLYKSKGIFKINAAANIGSSVVHYTSGNFENRGINFLCSIIYQLLGYRIDEYVEVNFEGFKDVVDAFGGVYITVDENMYNHKGGLIFAKGRNKMNGEEALQYARTRYRYDKNGKNLGSTGDSYRKKHQLNMLTEMAKQIVTLDNVLNASEIFKSLQGAIYHSFDLADIAAYASIGMDYANGEYKLETVLIQGASIDPMGDGVSYCQIY